MNIPDETPRLNSHAGQALSVPELRMLIIQKILRDHRQFEPIRSASTPGRASMDTISGDLLKFGSSLTHLPLQSEFDDYALNQTAKANGPDSAGHFRQIAAEEVSVLPGSAWNCTMPGSVYATREWSTNSPKLERRAHFPAPYVWPCTIGSASEKIGGRNSRLTQAMVIVIKRGDITRKANPSPCIR